jgi:hypothetical protein
LITGQKLVTLDFVADTPPSTHGEGDGAYPEIPTIASDDLGSVISSAKDLLASLRTTAISLDRLVSSREVARSARSLDNTLANLERITSDISNAKPGSLIAKRTDGPPLCPT